jgi:DNA modification methylase
MSAIQLELFPRKIDKSVPPKNGFPHYLHLEDCIPSDLPNGTFISLTRARPLKIHSVGFQPAKTIPEIVKWFLRKYTSASEWILDPFAGSGTTIIESLTAKRNIVWTDYQPLSQLICRLKTNRYEPLEVYQAAKTVIDNASKLKVTPTNINFRNKNFWFQKPVQAALESLFSEISTLPESLKTPLSIVFATTVRKCSDMNDGMILAAKRSGVQDVPQRSKQDVYRYFKYYAEKTATALAEWNKHFDPNKNNAIEITTHDARDLSGDWECDAIFTSPPYINAIDYVWAAKFELHWLKLVENDQDRLNLYSNEIGTERIPGTVYNELGQINHPKLDELLRSIYEGRSYKASKGQNELRSRVVYKYFVDMKKHFEECFRRLRSGGYYCFVVGESSRICGEKIPVATLLSEFAMEIGFEFDYRFNLLLKNRKLNIPRNVEWADTIKHDAVIVLRRP